MQQVPFNKTTLMLLMVSLCILGARDMLAFVDAGVVFSTNLGQVSLADSAFGFLSLLSYLVTGVFYFLLSIVVREASVST